MARGNQRGFVKAQNPVATIKRLLGFMSDKAPKIIVSLICVAISSVTSIAATGMIEPLIDKGIRPMIGNVTDEGMKVFISILATIAACYLFTMALQYTYNRIMVVVCNQTLNKIRNTLFSKMQNLPISYFDTNTHGELMSYYTNDVGALNEAISNGLISFVSCIITLVGIFIMMIRISPLMTVSMVFFMIIMSALTAFIGSRSVKNFKAHQAAVAKLNGYMEETMAGQKVVKVFTREEIIKSEFSSINEEARKAATRANIYGGIMGPLSNNLSHINYAFIAILGAYICITGNLGIGALAAFLQYSKNVSRPLSGLMQNFNGLSRAVAGAERIFGVLDLEDEVDEGSVELVNATFNENSEFVESEERTGLWAWKKPLENGGFELIRLRGDVRFKDVDFSYDGKKQVLNDVSFYAKPGQKIAFVGATGAGKTTITNLINRFYDIQSGTITYDGIDVKEIKKSSLRRSLAMVLQDTRLFTGTIMDNIRYGKLDASDEQCIEAAKLANADEFISLLPQGYETVITGDGSNLSQGQRQLLNIARAAVANAPVLILDEATSSIDTRTEKLIEEGMDNLMAGRTVFVIAHRLSTVRNSNAIMVLDHGEIIERGDHDELILQKGQYFKLYTGQFELD